MIPVSEPVQVEGTGITSSAQGQWKFEGHQETGYIRKGIENTKDYLTAGLALASLLESETLRSFILETNQALMGRDVPLLDKMAVLEDLARDFNLDADSTDEDKALHQAINVFLKRGSAILAFRAQRRENRKVREHMEFFALAARAKGPAA